MNSKKGIQTGLSGQARIWPLSKFRIVSLGSLVAFPGLLWIDFRYALALAAAYGLLILAAPYVLRFAFFLPIVNRGSATKNMVSLTFDDGPDPSVTTSLLALLARYQVKAAFFVVGENVRRFPHLIRQIAAQGHEIGNHSQTHDSFLMLRGIRAIRQEINDCQHQLNRLGIRPFAFRPPVGITNPVLFRVLLQLGLYCMGFSCRPRDFGNRRIDRLAEKVLSHVQPGHVILLHDKRPNQSFVVQNWLREIESILIGLQARNLAVVPLSQLIQRPVMRQVTPSIEPLAPQPVAEILTYLGRDSAVLFPPVPDASRQLPPRIRHKLTAEVTVLELDGLAGPNLFGLSEIVKRLAIVTHSREKAEMIDSDLLKRGTQNTTVLVNEVLQCNKAYDVVFTSSGYFFQTELQQAYANAFQTLNAGGMICFILPDKSVSGRWFLLKTALKTGLRVNLAGAKTTVAALTSAGFEDIDLLPLRDPFPAGLQIISAIKP